MKKGNPMNNLIKLILITLIISSGEKSYAAGTGSITFSTITPPTSINQPFSFSYYLRSPTKTKISSPSGIVTLYSYTDSNCSVGATQVGSPLDLSTSTTGTYSISSPGSYYLKPSIEGYTSNQCFGYTLKATTTAPITTTKPGIVTMSVPQSKTLKLGQTFSTSFSLYTPAQSKIKSPSGSLTLYSYTDSSCTVGMTQVGSSLDLSVSTTGTYSFSSPGSYYLKPSIVGYTSSQCDGPYTINQANIPFERLGISASIVNTKRTIFLRWENNSGVLSVETTSSASLKIYSDSSCSTVVPLPRPYSAIPKNGQASIILDLPDPTLYGKATSGLITSECIQIPSVTPTCTSEQHLDSVKNICVNNSRECDLLNGTGTETWDGSSFGACTLSSCDEGYYNNNGVCESDTRQCESSDGTGTGTQTWNGSEFGSCILDSCISSFQLDSSSNSCISSGNSSVSSGYGHTCALTSSGGVKCWGWNNYGQLGDGTTINSLVPVDVSGLTAGVVSLSAGSYHTCALTSSGGVKCWGNNRSGQLGDGTTANRLTPVDVTGLTSGVISVSSGSGNTCAVTSSGGVKCWGWNGYGQLGNGTTTNSLVPVDVFGLTSGVISVEAGGIHTCSVTSSGGVKCWGFNNNGQLGDGTTANRLTPVDVTGLTSGVVSLSAGGSHTCAVTSSGNVRCWGGNSYLQLGVFYFWVNTSSHWLTPVGITPSDGTKYISVSAGVDHTCALTSSGGVKCWGRGLHGRLGNSNTIDSPHHNAVVNLSEQIVSVSAGGSHTCALTSSGGVKCWGGNYFYGALGDGTTTNSSVPVDASFSYTQMVAVSAGGEHTCSLTSTGGVKCWGRNNYGQLGNGTYNNSSVPVSVIGLESGVVSLTSGSDHTCALITSGGIKCWGRSTYGQLGYGLTNSKSTPVDVYGLTSGVLSVSAGESHTCAVTSSGGAKCWGRNSKGQLGDGTTNNRWFPTDVLDSASGISSVVSGYQDSCALNSSGGFKCWGWDKWYSKMDNPSPSFINYFASSLSCGDDYRCYTQGGHVYCSGENGNYQLGDGSQVDRTLNSYSYVGIFGSTFSSVSTGKNHTCALTSSGKLYCWGDNEFGQIGDGVMETTTSYTNEGSIADKKTPVKIFNNGISFISLGRYHTCAVTSSGGVKCWGLNDYGQLGNGGTSNSSSPINVTGL